MKLKNTYLDNLTDYVNRHDPEADSRELQPDRRGDGAGLELHVDPNLQNIPIRTDEGRRIRLAFVPGDPGKNVLLTADYSQIELRVLAHFTQEPALMKAFEADEDIHRAVYAAEVFGVRQARAGHARSSAAQAKIINFGIIYGVSAFGLAKRGASKASTVQASRSELIRLVSQQAVPVEHPSVPASSACMGARRTRGMCEDDPRPPPANPGHQQRRAGEQSNAQAERMAINSVVQGSAADLIKQAMLNVHRRMMREKRPSRLLLQVHDELVFETPADRGGGRSVRNGAGRNGPATKAMKLSVPLLKVEVGWGKNWQEVK